MKHRTTTIAVSGAIALAVLVVGCGRGPTPKPADMVAAHKTSHDHATLDLVNPLNGVLFPRDIAAPRFRWNVGADRSAMWCVAVGDSGSIALSPALDTAEWTPSDNQWEAIKKASLDKSVTVTVIGISRANPERILSATNITISTSGDGVGAPIFYREVNLPFKDAVKDPSQIRWRFGPVSSKKQPPVVLDNLPVCGNCHSFSADGAVLGMDVDYANDKGSYAIAPVSEKIVLDDDTIITWADYKKETEQPTFGLLSQVSPSGRYVVSTVKDRSVFVPRPDLSYSQLFFPVKGILVVYDRQTETFSSLPGADDPEYVQSNPAWSPDEKYIVFARSKAYELKRASNRALLTEDECAEFLREGKTFLFDLYRVPFNDGKGGTPEPLAGASTNHMSNFFPKYSPDGKWIVFCKAKSFMLLQPDSELYIMPASGGAARRLACNNAATMNSWHSWSPDSRWLVFSSKLNGPYTQLFLTHIDAKGDSSIPALLDRFTSPDRAANIPEFVATTPRAIRKIKGAFVNATSFFRAGFEFAKAGDSDSAERCYRQALALDPTCAAAHDGLGRILILKGEVEPAITHFQQAIEYDPKLTSAYHNLGTFCLDQSDPHQAIHFFKKAIEVDPGLFESRHSMALALQSLGRVDEAIVQYRKAVRSNPTYAVAYFDLGVSLHAQGKIDEAIAQYRKAIEVDPRYAEAFYNLGMALGSKGRIEEAAAQLRKAVEVGGDRTPARARLSALQK